MNLSESCTLLSASGHSPRERLYYFSAYWSIEHPGNVLALALELEHQDFSPEFRNAC